MNTQNNSTQPNISINELTTEVRGLATEMRAGFKDVRMTTDRLAVEMEKGFAGVHKRVDDLEVSVDKKFGDLEVSVDKKIDNLGKRIDELEVSVDKKIGNLEVSVDKNIDTAFNNLAGMVAREFKVVHKELADIHTILNTDIPELKEDVEHLDHRMDIFQKSTGKDHDIRIRRIEHKLQIA